jgi:outer membrane murein-binding lipoprotein Lpp
VNEWESDNLERRLAEQAIFRQSLEERNAKIRDLESKVRYLTDLMNSLAAAPRPKAAGETAARTVLPVPRRWRT